MNLKLTRLAAFLPVLFVASEALSCGQGLSMSIGNTPYDFSSGAAPTIPVTVTRNAGASASNSCSFFLVIDNGITGTSYSTRQLTLGQQSYPVQFYSDSGHSSQIIKPFGSGLSATDVVDGQFNSPGSSPAIVNFYPFLDTALYFPNGQYSEMFLVSLYMGTPGSATLQQSLNVNFNYANMKKADLSLVETGAPFTPNRASLNYNFGQLVTGAQKAFDLVLKYNSGYQISMKSIYLNRLFNSTTNTFISYNLELNGQPLTLTGDYRIVQQTSGGPSLPNGLRLPLSVTIGSVTGAKPGKYTDTVMISISSN